MNKKFLTWGIVALTAIGTYAQSYSGTGIGIRGGEPSGITIKLYQGNSAFEFNIGTTIFYWSSWAGRRAERAALRNKPHPEDNLTTWSGVYRRGRLGLQAIYQPIFNGFSIGDLRGFYWYLGFGGQLNYGTLYWEAFYDHPDPVYDFYPYDHYRNGTIPDIDLGPVGMIGIEWILTPYDIPLALSLDLATYIEVIDQPLGKFYLLGNGAIRLLINEL